MFMAMIIQDFTLESKGLPLPVHVDAGKMIGYIPVYETIEDALSEFPNANVLEIREVKR